jgi:hypothetical protein
MNSKIMSFSGMMIAVVVFFASDNMVGNQQIFAFGRYWDHGAYSSHGFGPGYSYSPGYPIFPCGSGPYSTINGQIVCTPA